MSPGGCCPVHTGDPDPGGHPCRLPGAIRFKPIFRPHSIVTAVVVLYNTSTGKMRFHGPGGSFAPGHGGGVPGRKVIQLGEVHAKTSIMLESDKGPITIEGPVAGENLASLEIDENLNNFRTAIKQKQCLREIADSPDGLVYIARSGNLIVGYMTFHDPDPCTRWVNHPLVLELGAVEVSTSWRRYRIAKNLINLAFTNPLMRKRIVISMEYSWHWDLDGSGLNIWSYQKMLTRLFGSAGLVIVGTNDPEIMEHPANVLMARIGEDVPQEFIEMFDVIRYDKG